MRYALALLLALWPCAHVAAQVLPVVEGTLLVPEQAGYNMRVGRSSAVARVPARPGDPSLPPEGVLVLSILSHVQQAFAFHQPPGNAWTQTENLVTDHAGYVGSDAALTHDGVLAVLGAPARQVPPATGQSTGGVHVFRYTSTEARWVQEAVLRPSALPQSRYFGQSVAVARDGTGAAAATERVLALGGGRAWVFRRGVHPDSAWTEEARLEPDPGDSFQGLTVDYGTPNQRASLTVSPEGGWRAIAGGPYSRGPSSAGYSGVASIWRHDPGTPGGWVREARFGGAAGDCFGHSVAVVETGGTWLAAAGATQQCQGGGVGPGYVVVWRYDDVAGVWSEEARLGPPEHNLEGFGFGVALTALPGGGAALLASPLYLADPTGPNYFGAFLFERSAGAAPVAAWQPRARLVARTAEGIPGNATSLALAGTAAAIGNEYDTRFGAEAGALHVFDLSGYLPVDASPPPEPTAALGLTATPNPARGPSEVRLSVGAAGPARVAVLDALGRTVAVLHEGPLAAGSHRLPVPSLAAGMYVVRADVGGASATVRLARVR